VRSLAAERDIPPADYAKLMYKRVGTPAFLAFCEKHHVSADWLLCGDLKGLQRMTLERKHCKPDVLIVDRIMQKYRSLSPMFQAIIEETVDRLLQKQT
jgi:hypothetical protein